MEKKKKKHRNLFTESIDPRFSGIFNCNSNDVEEKNENKSQSSTNSTTESKLSVVNENAGVQNFLNSKLTEFLNSHIKEVDRPVFEQDFFLQKRKSIKLFSDSDPMSEEQVVDLPSQKQFKKKRKKPKLDKELLKEAVVSLDWLQRQSEILNS